MAPANWWFVLFAALPAYYIALAHAQGKRAAFAYGWLFGFGYFVFSLYWIGNALLVEGNPYKWAWPLAVAGLPAVLALYWGLGALFIHKFFKLDRLSGWFGFVGTIALFEWFRGHLFTGFPWNLFGYTWQNHLELLQILGLVDVYTLTLLTILWASVPAVLAFGGRKALRIPGAIAIISFALVHGYGLFCLRAYPDELREDVVVRVIQPNIDQAEKWQPELQAAHFNTLLRLSENSGQIGTDKTVILVWPETAFTYRYVNDPAAMEALRSAMATYSGEAKLLSGLLWRDPETKKYANSLVMIDKDARLSNIYNKHHLVPFGEYIPFQKYIPLAPIARFSGFETGPGPARLSLSDTLTYSPQVCYEAIFPNTLYPQDAARPDFIVNVTNDAWYGDSPGPYQHFVQAQFRAIEGGVTMIRSANTGVSAVIGPSGHILSKGNLMQEAVTEAQLPLQSKKPVLKAAFKNAIFLFLVFCLLLQTRFRKNCSANGNCAF